MQTGEDLISSIVEDENVVILNNPMKIIIRRIPSGKSVFMMMPWLPIEIVKEDYAVIYHSDIITMVDPKDSLAEYYQNTINNHIMEELRNSLEEELLDINSKEDDDDEEEELTEEDLIELEKYRKGKLFH